MRKAIAILLLFSVMVRPFTQVYYLIDFKLRQDYIAKVLCVNKNKPQLNCNGKCYLAKRLKAAEDREKQAHHQAFEKFELPIIICEEIFAHNFDRHYAIQPDPVDLYNESYSTKYISHFFHPPCLA
ncbi:hypothetical protein [Emticicia soli]|uniref:Uncharacterized protein n=1 Tax=Emticicia soli TaxID=2027878 RepID=A0ABW5J516_9BACT